MNRQSNGRKALFQRFCGQGSGGDACRRLDFVLLLAHHRFDAGAKPAGCVLLTIFSLSAPSRPSDSWIHESKLLALENAWNQAQLHHDSKALDSLVSDTFVYTDYDGTVMNKAQFLADLKDPTYRATLITNEGMKVFSYQDMAIVIGRYHTKGSYKRKPFEHYGRCGGVWQAIPA